MTAFSWSLSHLSCRASWCSEMSVAGSRSPTLSATSNQSLEAKRTQVPRNREGKEQPRPPLLADATNGSWQRHQPLPPSLGMPKTSPIPNACLSSRLSTKMYFIQGLSTPPRDPRTLYCPFLDQSPCKSIFFIRV